MDRLFKLQMACTKLAEGNNLGKTQNPFEEQRRPFSSARGLFHCLRLTDCHKEVESSSVAMFFTPDKDTPACQCSIQLQTWDFHLDPCN